MISSFGAVRLDPEALPEGELVDIRDIIAAVGGQDCVRYYDEPFSSLTEEQMQKVHEATLKVSTDLVALGVLDSYPDLADHQAFDEDATRGSYRLIPMSGSIVFDSALSKPAIKFPTEEGNETPLVEKVMLKRDAVVAHYVERPAEALEAFVAEFESYPTLEADIYLSCNVLNFNFRDLHELRKIASHFEMKMFEYLRPQRQFDPVPILRDVLKKIRSRQITAYVREADGLTTRALEPRDLVDRNLGFDGERGLVVVSSARDAPVAEIVGIDPQVDLTISGDDKASGPELGDHIEVSENDDRSLPRGRPPKQLWSAIEAIKALWPPGNVPPEKTNDAAFEEAIQWVRRNNKLPFGLTTFVRARKNQN